MRPRAGVRLTLLLVIHNLLRTATAVALTALSLTMASPARAGEGSVAPQSSSTVPRTGSIAHQTGSTAQQTGSTAPQASPCAAVVVPAGQFCVPSPKQCFTTPCPQYDLVAIPFHPRPSGGEAVASEGSAPAL